MGEDEKQRGGRYCEMIQEEGPNVSGLLMDWSDALSVSLLFSISLFSLLLFCDSLQAANCLHRC